MVSTQRSASSAIRLNLSSWFVAAGSTALWAVVVLVSGLGGRVLDAWESTVTMVFGSFLAGSSPEGGGAVAFPVFTKALEVPAPVARTFGLSIQAVGMTMASLSILVARRPFHRRAAVVGALAAVAGFAVGVAAFGRRGEPFWPSTIPVPWVKASFSIILATTSFLMVRRLRAGRRGRPGDDRRSGWNRRLDAGVAVAAAIGGLLSSLTGTGANIMIFLFLVVVVGVAAKEALPTAILVMTVVSIIGLVVFGVVDGQLDVEVVGDRVVSVGGTATDLAAGRADLLGLWLAAVPVVVWGAPLGSLVASLVAEEHLVRFVALLAGVEVATTVLLVPELRTDPALIAYLALGLVAVPFLFVWLGRERSRIFGPADPRL